MTLDLVRKRDGEDDYDWIRMLEPAEEAALRTVKRGGEVDEEMRALYLRTVGAARDDGCWFMCDCRSEGGMGPVIVPRQDAPERIHLVNRPDPPLPHAGHCVFAPAGDERPAPRRRAPQAAHDDRFDPFAPAEKKPAGDGPLGPAAPRSFSGLPAGSRHRTAANMLRTLMQTALLNTLDGATRFSSPGGWLPEIVRAAEQFFVADGVRAPEFLFTDPAQWTDGSVARRLEEAEPDWPKGGKPYAMLCWLARGLGDREINPANPRDGRVAVSSDIAAPRVFRNRVPGPWLFLGIVARPGDAGPWQCLFAWAQPIAAPECPLPVDSGHERRAVETLRRLIPRLEDDTALRSVAGAGVRVQLEKPLTPFETGRGPCLPDFVVTVTLRAADAEADPDSPDDHAPAARASAPGTGARYVIEVMGSDDPKYERRKADTHNRMREIGRVFRMEATEFDSRFNGIERQGERIARDIANDLVRRLSPAGGPAASSAAGRAVPALREEIGLR